MLKEGIYEHIINKDLEKSIKESENAKMVCLYKDVDSAESPKILANYISNAINRKLQEIESQKDRVSFINNLLSNAGILDVNEIVKPTELLTEVLNKNQGAIATTLKKETIRPLSGFRTSNLFTGGNSALPLYEEIRREIASSNEICLIVSFLRVSGVRILYNSLKEFCTKENSKLRIITTTYCGATQSKAIEQLSLLPNTEIKISYQTEIERLHAKSYIFLRDSGMHTAYIGSSNLSKSAQTDGLEWNVRVTSIENPHIIKSALGTFEQYWNSPHFEDFRIGGIEKFNKELNYITNRNSNTQVYQHFSLLLHQKQILEKIHVEREERGNYKNLIVAATGTGKTVISAFDYLNFKISNKRSRILFTAHREEILTQSLDTYRGVLCDPNFGALWVGAHTLKDKEDFNNLFISISMFNSRFDSVFSKLESDYYDYIVIDEAHHSQADSYRKLFSHFKPKILLGLTATPERTDGRDLRPDFGGRISAEIRLPQALQAGLLTPFQYFCISDDTDLSDSSLWRGNKYISEKLSKILCDTKRSNCIINALHRYIADEYKCKALCFCVNKDHAKFTAKQLCINGFSAQSLTDETPDKLRKQYARELREGKIHYLCVVDVFNEGVDIPEVDTVLFLRPTESLTIFLQQLGRGLRLSVEKNELTVLDFVSQVNQKFDYTNKFRALSLNPDKSVKEQVQNGFNSLPYGCEIILEKVARSYILENITSAIYNINRIIREINSYSETPSLSQFLNNNGQDIRILYRNNKCWTSIKRMAGKLNYEDDKITKRLEKGLSNLLHINSASYLRFINNFSKESNDNCLKENYTYSLMLYYALFQDNITKIGVKNIYQALEEVQNNEKYKIFKEEIHELSSYLLEHLSTITTPLKKSNIPNLELHGCYTREEIFTLVGRQTAERKMQGSVAGVFNLPEKKSILLFVTLNKSDKDFSPSTQYNDYVISDNLFHWQSQNTDSHNNRGGIKYLNHIKNEDKIILFVRENKQDGFGNTSAFHCFGLVDYESSNGDYPMNIVWKLQEQAMPQYLPAI